MNKGQFGLLTAALGLATMAGAGYVGYAHADSGHSTTTSGGSGAAVGGGQGSGTGSPGAPTDGATGSTGAAGVVTATGAASPSAGSGLTASAAQTSTPVPQCGDGDVQVSEASDGGASAGHQPVLIEFTNTSGHACYLRGYPGASVFGPNGKVLQDALRTMVGPEGGAAGVSSPQRVVLQVNGAASAIVEWSDVPAGSGTCLSPVNLGVTPPNSKQTTTFPLSGQPDVCSEFEVHPVVEGVSSSG